MTIIKNKLTTRYIALLLIFTFMILFPAQSYAFGEDEAVAQETKQEDGMGGGFNVPPPPTWDQLSSMLSPIPPPPAFDPSMRKSSRIPSAQMPSSPIPPLPAFDPSMRTQQMKQSFRNAHPKLFVAAVTGVVISAIVVTAAVTVGIVLTVKYVRARKARNAKKNVETSKNTIHAN